MSAANKCDLCEALYEPTARTVSLDVAVATVKDPNTFVNWEDVDFCQSCSEKVLKLIGPALSGLDDAE